MPAGACGHRRATRGPRVAHRLLDLGPRGPNAVPRERGFPSRIVYGTRPDTVTISPEPGRRADRSTPQAFGSPPGRRPSGPARDRIAFCIALKRGFPTAGAELQGWCPAGPVPGPHTCLTGPARLSQVIQGDRGRDGLGCPGDQPALPAHAAGDRAASPASRRLRASWESLMRICVHNELMYADRAPAHDVVAHVAEGARGRTSTPGDHAGVRVEGRWCLASGHPQESAVCSVRPMGRIRSHRSVGSRVRGDAGRHGPGPALGAGRLAPATTRRRIGRPRPRFLTTPGG